MKLLDAFEKPRRVTGFLSLARRLLDVTTDFTKQSPLGCILTPVVFHWTLTMHELDTFSALLSLAHSFSFFQTQTSVSDDSPHMVNNHPVSVFVRGCEEHTRRSGVTCLNTGPPDTRLPCEVPTDTARVSQYKGRMGGV